MDTGLRGGEVPQKGAGAHLSRPCSTNLPPQGGVGVDRALVLKASVGPLHAAAMAVHCPMTGGPNKVTRWPRA